MTVHRTTKPGFGQPRRNRGAAFRALAFYALLAGASPSAVADDADIRLSLVATSEHAPQLPPILHIAGTWANSCVPTVERTTVDNHNIDIHLRASTDHCAAAVTPLDLKVNPAKAAGREELGSGIYEVRLFLSQPGGSSELVAFRLLLAGAVDATAQPENGFWWSVPTADKAPALAGSGLTIERQGDNLAITLLSYEAGTPVWYFGSTKMQGNIARAPLTRMIGGAEPFAIAASSPGAEPGPTLNLSVLGPAHAQAWLVRPRPGAAQAIETQELNLMRLPFESGHPGATWRGQWILIEADARAARMIDLADAVTADAESFRLRDSDGSTILHCRLIDIGGHSMPALCSLIDGETVLADFDRIGLDRLGGYTPDGTAVQFVRLPR
jgi:hypothetical protein